MFLDDMSYFMLIGYINTESLYNMKQTGEKSMYCRVRRKALSQPVRLLFLVWVLFLELSKKAERVCAFKEFLQLCVSWMHGVE